MPSGIPLTPWSHQRDTSLKLQERQKVETDPRERHHGRYQSCHLSIRPVNRLYRGINQSTLPPFRGGGWFSSWCGWTRTPSAWWGGGGATQCSATSTQWQIVSPKASQPRCSNMSHTRYFFRLTPATSAKQHSRDLKAPSARGFCRPGTGSVWYWQHKYRRFSPLIV